MSLTRAQVEARLACLAAADPDDRILDCDTCPCLDLCNEDDEEGYATNRLVAEAVRATMDALEASEKVSEWLAQEWSHADFSRDCEDCPAPCPDSSQDDAGCADAILATARKATEESVCDNCNRNNGGECSKAEVGKREYCPAREATGGTDEAK